MHKILVLYPFPQDERKFRPYYEDVHMPLVAKLPGLKAYRHSFSISAPPGAPVPFYCIFEAEFADRPAMIAAMTSPAGQAVVADAANFATTPATVVHYDVAG
ncbi:MAG: EthD family reductase [Propylenella sp.]